MRKPITQFTYTVSALALLAAFVGCADLSLLEPQPDLTRFYYLEDRATANGGDGGIAIRVGPSSVAKYLDKPTIATFPQQNNVEYSTTNRWAEPLQDSVDRYLVNILSSELETSRVGTQRVMGSHEFDYSVGYHLLKLGGQVDSETKLVLSWWITSADGTESLFKTSRYAVESGTADRGFDGYVQRIQTVVRLWAKDVVKTIRTLEAERKVS